MVDIPKMLDAASESSAWWVRWTGARYLARWQRQRMDLAMRGLGATFFPSRDALNQSRNFNKFLGSAENIDAIFVTGRVFIQESHTRFRRINRLILPDPNSASFKFYAEATGETDLVECIRRATVICRDQIKIEVRWCPEIIQQAILIGDSGERTGWVHTEFVLPCSKANMRPSITVYKTRFADLVQTYQQIFNQLWDLSKEPPPQPPMPRQLPSPAPSSNLAEKLMTPGWILNHNPTRPEGRKPISFKPGGEIGAGRNSNEFRWQIKNNMLEIHRENGHLQNRFGYDASADRFVSTNDPDKKGLDDQVIYRAQLTTSG